ncbi:MAG TPA: tetratricopeptide repeat protein [Thermoanaerobaculia bacterium]|nr:tetratricopeptide repeat protein [Thermoanaerobaculia bacterium]
MCKRTLGAVMLALLVLARSASAESVAIPWTNLDRLEPFVAEQLTAARTSLEAALERDDLAPEQLASILVDVGLAAHAYGLHETAAACYQLALEKLADRGAQAAPIWHLLGLNEVAAGRVSEAIGAFRRACDDAEVQPACWLELGRACLLVGELQEAEKVFRSALELDPGSAPALEGLGQIALARDRPAEAVVFLERALALVPEANRVHYPLAQAYRKIGDAPAAEAHLAKRGLVGPKIPDPWADRVAAARGGERLAISRGRLALQAGDVASAVAAFEEAVAAAPKSVPAWVNLGVARSRAGRNEEAIAALRTAAGLDPANLTAQYNLALLLAGLGRWNEACAAVEAALALDHNDPVMNREMARCLGRAGRTDLALDAWQRAADLAPETEEPLLGKAALLVALGRFTEAVSVLEGSLTFDPARGRSAAALARLLASCPDAALRNGTRALDLATRVYAAAPTAAHAGLLADSLAELGRCEEAAGWQGKMLEVAESLSAEQRAALEATRARYAAGPPCRPPAATPPE